MLSDCATAKTSDAQNVPNRTVADTDTVLLTYIVTLQRLKSDWLCVSPVFRVQPD